MGERQQQWDNVGGGWMPGWSNCYSQGGMHRPTAAWSWKENTRIMACLGLEMSVAATREFYLIGHILAEKGPALVALLRFFDSSTQTFTYHGSGLDPLGFLRWGFLTRSSRQPAMASPRKQRESKDLVAYSLW